LIASEELDRADAITSSLRDDAGARGSLLRFLMASTFAAGIETKRGNLTVAAGELRAACEGALEHGIFFAIPTLLWSAVDVLLERPDVADLAALAETIDLGPMAEVFNGALVLVVRGQLRFAAGERAAGIDDLRGAGAIVNALNVSNPNLVAWRSTLARMLPERDRAEACELATAELADARRIGTARGIGVALRVLGSVEADGLGRLEESVAVLADSPARLEHARTLIDLGSAMRRQGNRAAARDPLGRGLDLAVRCGATRLTEHARTELAATGARPRRLYHANRDVLTPSELRVARLAAEGHASQEIAEMLFVTTKTIDAHLHHTYAKLGINSRRQLAAALLELGS
jgi:DNA-binding CsgD family transcriptional regulator